MRRKKSSAETAKGERKSGQAGQNKSRKEISRRHGNGQRENRRESKRRHGSGKSKIRGESGRSYEDGEAECGQQERR